MSYCPMNGVRHAVEPTGYTAGLSHIEDSERDKTATEERRREPSEAWSVIGGKLDSM